MLLLSSLLVSGRQGTLKEYIPKVIRLIIVILQEQTFPLDSSLPHPAFHVLNPRTQILVFFALAQLCSFSSTCLVIYQTSKNLSRLTSGLVQGHGRGCSTHRPFDRVLIHLEHLEMGECREIAR